MADQQKDDYFEVVINESYGAFRISDEAIKRYEELTNTNQDGNSMFYRRDDPILVQVVRELGDHAHGDTDQRLSIVKVPIDFKDCYEIEEYDGQESINTSPARLIARKLKNLDVINADAKECKEVLLQIKKLLCRPPQKLQLFSAE